MHEFQITTDNTALITIYEPIVTDLSSIGGPSEGYLLDSIFQEISKKFQSALAKFYLSGQLLLMFL